MISLSEPFYMLHLRFLPSIQSKLSIKKKQETGRQKLLKVWFALRDSWIYQPRKDVFCALDWLVNTQKFLTEG